MQTFRGIFSEKSSKISPAAGHSAAKAAVGTVMRRIEALNFQHRSTETAFLSHEVFLGNHAVFFRIGVEIVFGEVRKDVAVAATVGYRPRRSPEHTPQRKTGQLVNRPERRLPVSLQLLMVNLTCHLLSY